MTTRDIDPINHIDEAAEYQGNQEGNEKYETREIDGVLVAVLYRPTGPEEMALLQQSDYRLWPPRLPEQPIFYPVTNEEYAKEIAIRWNIKDSKIGYVTRFYVQKSFIDQYPIQKVGTRHHTEWWIPADDVPALNAHLIGSIEVIGEYL